MALTTAEREWLQRIEDKLDRYHDCLTTVKQRVAVVESRQDECPARKWAQPSMVVAVGAILIAAVPVVIQLIETYR